MENDLISRQALLTANMYGNTAPITHRTYAENIIKAAPAVDAVEVVRCKDCEHWADCVSGCTEHVKCCKIGFYMVDENGYCVYGKRRADNAVEN